MDMGDDNGDMSGMMMVMTFGSWSDYQLKLLFESWDIKNRWQFALSWLAVVGATISYQGIKFWLIYYETNLMIKATKRSSIADQVEDTNELPVNVFSNGGSLMDSLLDSSMMNMSFKERIVHAFVSAVNYGFALLLMLVAMTYNPCLFLALVVGYGLGDVVFFNKICSQRSSKYASVPNGIKECH